MRYLRLIFHFFKNCLIREMEFRFNLIIWILFNFAYLALAILGTELLFGQVTSIAGWDKQHVLLLVYVTGLFNDFLWTFVFLNINTFSHQVRHGELDFALLKPINTRFLVSTRYFDFDHYPRMILLIFLLNQGVISLGFPSNLFLWLGFATLFFMGIFIFYNLFFMFTTLNIWLVRLFNLSDLFGTLVDLGHRPLPIFGPKTRFFLSYFLPVAFVSYFPVLFLTRQLGWEIFPIGLILCLATFYLSELFWRFALRHYSSASS